MGKLAAAWILAAIALAGADAPPGMVLIPGGEYLRGRGFVWPDYTVKWYPNPAKDDEPARKIRVASFFLDQSEVTIGRYASFVKAAHHRAPYSWKGGSPPEGKADYPVSDVSWDDAVAFCAWDGGKRLPTEAEWERAAKGSQDDKMYPWGDRDITAKDAVYNQVDGARPVCQKTKNEYGLCDMIGNVWEWCSDWYGQRYYQDSPDHDPVGPETGLYRVLRGGSWFDVPKLFLTTSYRSWARPGERSPTIGFRCARLAQGSVH